MVCGWIKQTTSLIALKGELSSSSSLGTQRRVYKILLVYALFNDTSIVARKNSGNYIIHEFW